MKTQSFGFSGALYTKFKDEIRPERFPDPTFTPYFALKNYRENRENGDATDNPKTFFPSAGFDSLDIKFIDVQDWLKKWPDSQGCYWWKITLTNGQIINNFYWKEDKIRGYPDKANKDRYWFTVCHTNGTKIEGFSQEPDYQKGFPDNNRKYWYYMQFTDIHCPAIRQWMIDKDRNYQIRRITSLISILYQPTRVEDGFNLFTALPDELQLIIFEFVLDVKLTHDLFKHARDLAARKEILMESATPISSKCEENPEVTTNQLSSNNDGEFYSSFKK